ncbi:DMT family transporter, partial [Candidatus Micrarchaeota archaeon]|nr:DMT family transporter [Candidatus Micrarchaeota archaeon]
LSIERKENKFVLGKGVVFALLTLVGWGAYFAMIKPIVLELNPFNAALFTESIIFFMILVYSVGTKKEFKLNERKSNIFLFANAVLLIIGLLSYNYSITLIGASLTAIIVAPSPILTSVLARIFLKERLSKTKYIAIIVSITGLVLLFI